MVETGAATPAALPAPAPPTKIWQYLILYPTLALSIGGSVPTVIQEVKAWRIGVRSSELQLVQEQTRLWSRNAACLQQGSSYEVDGPHNIVVRVTLCQSTGDTLLRYHVGAWEPIFKWVALPVEKVNK